MPFLLTVIHNHNLVGTLKEYLALFNRNPDEFLLRIIVFVFTIAHRIKTSSRNSGFLLTNRRRRRLRWIDKIMAMICWNARGFIGINYLQNGRIDIGDCYAKLIETISQCFKKWRLHLVKKNVLFHQDNSILQTCIVAWAKGLKGD